MNYYVAIIRTKGFYNVCLVEAELPEEANRKVIDHISSENEYRKKWNDLHRGLPEHEMKKLITEHDIHISPVRTYLKDNGIDGVVSLNR